ncbi:GroES-like protein [Panus rudis PR-1116 ss-1]|nr:GroES-like protein [Panus rudis PR-1116 ss-1]
MTKGPKQQKALVVPAQHAMPGIQTIDVPSPGVNEVLVRVKAMSLSPGDELVKGIGPPWFEYPTVLGFDAAGVVVELAEGVDNLVVGNKLIIQAFAKFPHDLHSGGYRQYAVVPADIVVQIFDNLGFNEAFTLLTNLATALAGLFGDNRRAGLAPFWTGEGKDGYKKQPILILSGAKFYGSLYNSLNLQGPPPLSLGVTYVIDCTHSRSQLVSESCDTVPQRFQTIYDAFAISETQKAYDILASGGTLIFVKPSALDSEKAKENKKVREGFASCLHTAVVDNR